ncbi:NADP-dependent oxidoreductase [Phenylobacterium sp. NIBR 498073]|uniref:NADP-dependent oxidoreductase n=1 Tax=Phenylobacterium sp. NIBR 498073 TaxID=3015177 RepID=UPI0022B5B161|nr:NADP-dependent oxidoreductase [Phenylobacterium sp. NIBR 498073]WGU39332.1 NADP-dependent oxidoreductase [Phenylobacterium sp. NIBR 498073]
MPTNRQWILRRRPAGEIVPDDLELIETATPELQDGEVLVRNIYLSLDPTHRIWMSDQDQYLPPVQIGEVMRGGAIGVVEQSRNAALPEGAIVNAGLGGWQDYAVVHEGMARRVPHLADVPLTAHMSVLGATGLTAYFGLNDIGKPQPGETVVVSAAAGAVGSIVGQLAKLQGCRVIGIAGGPKKCRWLTQDLGFDGAIDYRSEDVGEALARLAPNGVDINFENVGGDVMDAVIGHMNNFSRMPLCGMISTYNREGAVPGPSDFGRVLMHRILIKGFIVIDYLPRAAEAMAELEPLVAGGQLKWKVHIVDGLENAVGALGRLFTGDHDGKLLVQVSPEPKRA